MTSADRPAPLAAGPARDDALQDGALQDGAPQAGAPQDGDAVLAADRPPLPQTLATAQLSWQIGDWARLAALDPGPGAAATPEGRRLLAFRLQGLFQTGDVTDAGRMCDAFFPDSGARMDVARLLLSGACTSLSRARMLRGDAEAAERLVRDAVALHPSLGDPDLVAGLRLACQRRALLPPAEEAALSSGRSRKLFVDCGAYDGCSVILFLLSHPEFDCISFEPNPVLWKYFDDLPTTLIRAAAYTHDGEIAFIVDPVDADGSSVVEGKKVDFHDSVSDKDCPRITVPCVNMSRFICEQAERYDSIYLKLDVEGAEYDILEQMLDDGSLRKVTRLFCEFHAGKMAEPDRRHDRILRQAQAVLEVGTWDAIPLSIHKKTPATKLAAQRRLLIRAILDNRRRLTSP